MFQKQDDLVRDRERLGVTNRDIGCAIGMRPSTVASKLCGFSPLTYGERQKIVEYFERIEREQGACEISNKGNRSHE